MAAHARDDMGAATAPTGDWPADWRERMARQVGGDEKTLAKELRRLQRFASPAAVYASERDLEAKLSAGGLVRIPGAKASPAEKAAFARAMGVPDTPAGYLDRIRLAHNRILGEADRPVVESFASALHPLGATPAVVSAAADWWFNYQQAHADQREESDGAFRAASESGLRHEWGADYKANTAAIATLISVAPPEVGAVFASARDGDGNLLGNHAGILKWLHGLAVELIPAGQNYGSETTAASDRLSEIRKIARETPQLYTKELEAEQTALIAQGQRGRRR